MKNLLLTLLLCLFAISSYAQEEPEYITYRFYEGYIITKSGEEKRGYIQYLPEANRYSKVVFKSTMKGKKEKYNPKNLKGYKVASVLYHAVQFEDVIMKGLKFLALEKDGCMKSYTFRKYSPEDQSWATIMVLATENRAVSTQTFALSFAKKASSFFKDQPEIANKIQNKEKGYRVLALEKMIDEYNQNCKS